MGAERVGVVGLGLLGRGIAACLVGHGFEVVAVDRSDSQQAAARREIEQMVEELVSLAGFDPKLRGEWSSRYTAATTFDVLRGCEFVVESVAEDVMTKDEVLDAVEAVVSPTAIIGSNTSSIPITRLQRGRIHFRRFIGMHWAEPAHFTRFLELIRGEQTGDDVLEATAALGRRLGKDPCLCQKDIPAFIVNRIGYAMYREALSLLDAGVADADTIDRAVRNSVGLWATLCGPLRWIDISGGPVGYAKAMERVLPTLSKSDDISPTLRALAESGARGIANGRGFFEYSQESALHWQELYRRHAWRVSRMQDEYFPIPHEAPP